MEKRRKRVVIPIASSRNYRESRRIYAKSLEIWHNSHKEEFLQISAELEYNVVISKPKKAFTKVFGTLVEVPLTKALELEQLNITIIYKY